MKASNYQRRHQGPLANKILKTLMEYHGCQNHNGPNRTTVATAHEAACLADFLRADLICDVLEADAATAQEVFDKMWASGDWEGQVSMGFAATFSQELDHARAQI